MEEHGPSGRLSGGHGPSGRLSGGHGPSGRPSGEHGQALPLVVLVAVGACGLLIGLARFGAVATDAARAGAAADAAALAGAAEGRGEAVALAAANDGRVATYEVDGRDVEVRVRVGSAWAVARARRTGGAGPGVAGWVGTDGSGGVAGGVVPALRARLADAARVLRQPVPLTRSGGSTVDVPRSFVARLAAVGGRVGLCRPAPRTHPVRFAACPDRT